MTSRNARLRALVFRIGRATRGVEPPQPAAVMAAIGVVVGMVGMSARPAILTISQGVMMTATKKEKIIAAEALAGIGRHVGAHQARHEQHRQQRRDHGQRGDDGGVADLGHRVDRGLDAGLAGASMPQWRAMFSITTMASSTRMPMEKISANSDTRFSV